MNIVESKVWVGVACTILSSPRQQNLRVKSGSSKAPTGMRYPIGLLLLMAIVCAAAAADHGVVRASTTACLGECPVYTFYLFADDTYVFDGREFTKTDRISSGKLDSGAFVDLIGLLEANRFEEFEDHYGWGNKEACKELRTDYPSTTIQVQTASLSKSVHVYWGCRGFFRESELLAIDQAITHLLIGEGLLVSREKDETKGNER